MIYSFDNISDLTLDDGGIFRCSSLESAYEFASKLAISHYENFPVGSILIPKHLRKHIYSIYSFARTADDIADENLKFSTSERIDLLDKYLSLLHELKKEINNPIFVALLNTIQELNLPVEPFENLINAFKQDINFQQPDKIDDLLNYCKCSANPVGELVLRVFGEYNELTVDYSDKICTALQLTNFWQDFSIDLINNRNYIPCSILEKYGIRDISNEKDEKLISSCLDELYHFTYELFEQGSAIISHIRNFRLKLELKATIHGGKTILKASRALGQGILTERPKLRKTDLFKMILKTIFE